MVLKIVSRQKRVPSDLRVCDRKVWRAVDTWEACKENINSGEDLHDSKHSLPVVHYLLINMLAAAFPEQTAHRTSDRRWYSANGFRVRGKALLMPALASSSHCFLFAPRVERHKNKNKQDATMTHLRSNLCLNLRFEWYPLKTVSICSDSTLAAPAFIYGLAC